MHGELVGDYEIVREIGGGGNGIVYEARHRGLKKRFALKRVSPTHPDYEEIVRRFANEGETAARISHPNAVNVSDVGLDEAGAPYSKVVDFGISKVLPDPLQRDGLLSKGEDVAFGEG